MTYLVLTTEEQEEILVQFLHAQERDHFCHAINQQRYDAMLKQDLSGIPAFHERVKTLKAETDARLAEVEAIMSETVSQIRQIDVAAVKARLDQKASRA